MRFVVVVLSVLDIIGAITLIFGIRPLWFLGIPIFIKGVSSLTGSLTSGFIFDFPGIVDVVAGLALILMLNITSTWFAKIGLAYLLKGIIMLIFSLPVVV